MKNQSYKDELLYIKNSMKYNNYKDELLYIKNCSKHEKNKLRIDFIIKMIDDVGLDKINDIIIDKDRAIILFKHNIIEPEKLFYNKLLNLDYYLYFILESQISFNLSSPKIYVTHWLNYKRPNWYPLYISFKKYQNIYKVYKPLQAQEMTLGGSLALNNNNKNTVLCKNINSEAFDIKIPDYLNYIYNTSKDIEKELIKFKISKEKILDFIEHEDIGANIIEHRRRIELIKNFFNKNEFITKDNLYTFIQYNCKHDISSINGFTKIFDIFLSRLL